MSQKIYRVVNKQVHRALYRSGVSARVGLLKAKWVPSTDRHQPQLAFVCSRKVGNAVTRNRLRRICRESLRTSGPINTGSFLITISPGAAALSPKVLRLNLGELVDKLNSKIEIQQDSPARSTSELCGGVG